MKLKIADFNWEINEKYDTLSKEGKDFIASFSDADFSLTVSDKDLILENSLSEFPCSKSYLEYVAVLRKMAEILPLNDGFVLHSACIDVEGEGVAFLAPSGTGKTTHLISWIKYLKDKVTIVNGDKPIVRFIDDTPLAYGTPWMGKEKLGQNTKTTLKHLCFIERGPENKALEITKEEAIDKILNQIYMPKNNPEATFKIIELANKLLSSCKLWTIYCNLDENAGEITYKTIIKKD